MGDWCKGLHVALWLRRKSFDYFISFYYLKSFTNIDIHMEEDKRQSDTMCGECKFFSYNVMGEAICTNEKGNKKASPYVGACYDFFTPKNK